MPAAYAVRRHRRLGNVVGLDRHRHQFWCLGADAVAQLAYPIAGLAHGPAMLKREGALAQASVRHCCARSFYGALRTLQFILISIAKIGVRSGIPGIYRCGGRMLMHSHPARLLQQRAGVFQYCYCENPKVYFSWRGVRNGAFDNI
ncbi:hypothetical protein BA896_002375 [Janthinobacterium lividum]|uniref:Uncharacterized protein n=1 Tax=Janthinobacterium lividum TaxID=29581 RepID=A0A1E8PQG6_9BURK|nr:hypothetical protein BA896_002375 [Janthinobacterium lividum]